MMSAVYTIPKELHTHGSLCLFGCLGVVGPVVRIILQEILAVPEQSRVSTWRSRMRHECAGRVVNDEFVIPVALLLGQESEID